MSSHSLSVSKVVPFNSVRNDACVMLPSFCGLTVRRTTDGALMPTCESLNSQYSLFRKIAVGTAIKMTTTATPNTARSTLAKETCAEKRRGKKVRKPLQKSSRRSSPPTRHRLSEYQQTTNTNHYFFSEVCNPNPSGSQLQRSSRLDARTALKLCATPALLLNIISS